MVFEASLVDSAAWGRHQTLLLGQVVALFPVNYYVLHCNYKKPDTASGSTVILPFSLEYS